MATSKAVVLEIVRELGPERSILFLAGLNAGVQFALDHRPRAKRFQLVIDEIIDEACPDAPSREDRAEAAKSISKTISEAE